VGFLDRLLGRRGRGSGAPAPTRDDTLSSTYVPPPTPVPGDPDDSRDDDARDDDQGAQSDQGWVEPSTEGIQGDTSSEVAASDADAGDAGAGDAGGGDGGGGNGGGNGGGGGD
jgi:hypothetical protein